MAAIVGGRLCRKLLKRKYFAMLKVNKSVSICFETYKVSNCVLLLTQARAFALDDNIYASPGSYIF